MLRFEQLLHFGATYFPSKTCNSMPGWHLSLMPENHMDYAEVRQAAGGFAECQVLGQRGRGR